MALNDKKGEDEDNEKQVTHYQSTEARKLTIAGYLKLTSYINVTLLVEETFVKRA